MISARDLAAIDGDHQLTLSKDEQASMLLLLRGACLNPYENTEDFVLNAKLLFHSFPERVRRRVIHFGRFGNIEGVLLVRRLPTDDPLPATPKHSCRSIAKTTYRSETWLASFAAALGEPVAYVQEKDGAVFRDVCPTEQNETEWSSESSSILLPFHTEADFHPFLPSYVMLYCLRPDHEGRARTMVASIRRITPHLTPSLISVLREAVFETGIDYSFGVPTGRRGGGLVTAICHGSNADPYFRFDPGLMKAHSPDGERAMDALNRIIEDVAMFTCLSSGDLLIMDNRRTVHARTEFSARYDGLDRWLQRVYVVDSLSPSAGDRLGDGRVISTEFNVG